MIKLIPVLLLQHQPVLRHNSPGIVLILYSTAANVSVAKMFYAGYIPGLFIMAALMCLNYFISKSAIISRLEKASLREFGEPLKDAIWALFVPLGL